ncbi:MAG: GMP synthase (glutamine-hydrolyzing) [Alphaproteobacteria bacterium]|jgi:GMP synthase (glutamine-hydrolysing)
MTVKQRCIAIFSHGSTPRLGALQTALAKSNLSWKIIQLAKGDKAPTGTEAFDGVILMGGPMGVYERDEHACLDVEMTWVEIMIKAGKPVFGICLGCQMLAHVHRGDVFVGDKGFCVGFRDLNMDHTDHTFGHELAGQKGFSWHGDTYTLGDGCDRLISGEYYHEQGVKFADKVYGVQFHPEVTEEVISAWYMRDIQSDSLPVCAKPMHACLDEAALHLAPVHNWLDKFIARLFTE